MQIYDLQYNLVTHWSPPACGRIVDIQVQLSGKGGTDDIYYIAEQQHDDRHIKEFVRLS